MLANRVAFTARLVLARPAASYIGSVRYMSQAEEARPSNKAKQSKPREEDRPAPSQEALDMAKRILTSSEFFDRPMLNKVKRQEAINAFQRHPVDTGSSEVQVAVLSERILRLQEHFSKNKRDIHSRRGLMELMQRRRKLLLYMEPRDPEAYLRVVEKYQIREGKGPSRVTVRPETWSPPRKKEDVEYRPKNWLDFKKASADKIIVKRG